MNAKRLTFVVLTTGVALLLTGCGMVIDSEGAKIGNPADFAQATHIAQMSDAAAISTRTAVDIVSTRQVAYIQAMATEQAARVSAAATESAIDHQAAQARADEAKAGASVVLAQSETEQRAQGAALAGKATLYLFGWAGLGVGALVLLVGTAFGIVALVNKRATSVYPDARGQFPVIVRSGLGWIAYHDPNRALGSGAVLRTPTPLDALTGVAIATITAIKTGDTPRLPTAEPCAAFALPGSEAAMLQIATQAQAAQVRIAEQSGRPELVMAMMGAVGQAQSEKKNARLPPITLINDPAQIAAFEQKLLSDGGEE